MSPFYGWLNLQASSFCNFRFKPLFLNLILKFLLQTRPLQDGTTFEDEDFLDQEWAGARTSEDGNFLIFLIFIKRPWTKTRTATRASVLKKCMKQGLDVLVILILGRPRN